MAAKGTLKGAIGVGTVIALVLALLVIVVAAGIFLNSAHGTQAPSFANTNLTVPQEFSSLPNASSASATHSLVVLAQSHLANLSQFTILYMGSIEVKPSGIAGDIASLDSPFYIGDYKYANSSKFYLNVTSVPAIGHAEMTYFNGSSGPSFCSNINASALFYGNTSAAITGSHAITCTDTKEIASLNIGQLVNFNLSQALGGTGVHFGYETVYQSSYYGTPCTYISGPVENGTSAQIGTFQMCESNAYFVPLSMYVSASAQGGTFNMGMNETYISNSSSPGDVAMPS